jgi:hypothetical protein
MAYQMIREEDYPTTGLPVYRVYDADEYQDVTVKRPLPVGEVWGVGVKGVTGRFVLTGFRYGLAGEGPVAQAGRADATGPFSSCADAARAMIAEFEARMDGTGF